MAVREIDPSDEGEAHGPARLGAKLAKVLTEGLRRPVETLVELLVPATCVACRTPLMHHDTLCTSCWSGIRFIRPPICDRLGLPLPFDTGGPTISAAALAKPPVYDRARAVAEHAGTIRRLVHQLKYEDQTQAVRLMGRLMAGAARELLPGIDVIVPVPLARFRLWWRRYNQAALLAASLARRTGIAHDPFLVVRKRSTASQVGLTAAEREANVAGAFAVPERARSRLAGKAVLLVDDVITTGATVEAVARALKRAGAARVDVAALALATGTPDGRLPALGAAP